MDVIVPVAACVLPIAQLAQWPLWKPLHDSNHSSQYIGFVAPQLWHWNAACIAGALMLLFKSKSWFVFQWWDCQSTEFPLKSVI
jgi:hypothetical protein